MIDVRSMLVIEMFYDEFVLNKLAAYLFSAEGKSYQQFSLLSKFIRNPYDQYRIENFDNNWLDPYNERVFISYEEGNFSKIIKRDFGKRYLQPNKEQIQWW